MVIHGERDRVIPATGAQAFVADLGAVSTAAVRYFEIPGAGHGFDLTDSRASHAAIEATTHFLQAVHDQHRRRSKSHVGVLR